MTVLDAAAVFGANSAVRTVLVAITAAVVVGPVLVRLARRAALTVLPPAGTGDAAAVAFAGIAVAAVVLGDPADVPVVLPLAVLGGAAALVDAAEGRLPDLLTGPLLAITLLGAGLSTAFDYGGALAEPGATAASLGAATAAAAGGTLVALILKFAASAAFGWGDVKLAPTVAIVLIREDAIATGIVGMCLVLGATCVVVALPRRRSHRGEVVPYGPALVLGTLGAAVAG